MNQKLFEKRLQVLLDTFSTNQQKISVLREVIAQSPKGRYFRRSLCKGFSKDEAINQAIADVCNQWIDNFSQVQQLTIFDALQERGAG